MCSKGTHHSLNSWLYYIVIYHLITIHISEWRHFSDIHIWQGSVATRLRRGGIFKHVCCKFTTESASEKFENRLIFGEVMGKSLVSCFLLTHGVYHTLLWRRVYESSSCLPAFSHRIFKQNNCNVKYFSWKYQTMFRFFRSCSSLFTFLLSSQFHWHICVKNLQLTFLTHPVQ